MSNVQYGREMLWNIYHHFPTWGIQSFSSEKKATPDPLSYYASGWIALISSR